MTSHLLFQHWMNNGQPRLKNYWWIIRKWIGFDGLLVTDCLFMEASRVVFLKEFNVFNFGCDVALHSHGELADLEKL